MKNVEVVITKTPLRVSLIGGGTDMPYFYNKFGGATISFAINKYIYVVAKYHNNFQEKYRLNYSETENTNRLNDIKNLRIKEVIKELKITRPLYISTFSDIPSNSGLGSSSSFTVGLLHALFKLEKKKFSKKMLAEIAYKIEAKITNNSLGKQDHYIAAFGGIKHIKYAKNKIMISPIILNKKKLKHLFNSFLLIWTGKARQSVDILLNQKKNAKNNYKNLNVLNKLTINFLNKMKKKELNIEEMGKIISETWQIKKKFSKLVTNEHINKIYNKIIHNTYGGKLLGAGNGGFVLSLINYKNKKKIIKNIKRYEYLSFELEKNGSIIL
jgi:D-glycero-alpha-D-manno-heptose-7-phosphate kinase